MEDISPATQSLGVPYVTQKEYTLLNISADGFCSLRAADGSMREDIKLPQDYPEGLARLIQQDFESGKALTVSVTSAMGREQILAYKDNSEAKA